MNKTSDIWMAAYLFRLGHKIVKVDKQANKMFFYFNIDTEAWTIAKVAFASSEESNLKYTIEKLKDIIFQ